MHAIHVSEDNSQHSQHGLAAVRGFGGRDEFARQEFGGGDRIPHEEAGQPHDDGAPHKGPVFGFLARFRTEKKHLYKLIGAGSHRTDKIELNTKLIRGEATCHDSLFDFCTFHQSYLA